MKRYLLLIAIAVFSAAAACSSGSSPTATSTTPPTPTNIVVNTGSPTPSSVRRLAREESFFQGLNIQHLKNGIEGVSDLSAAGKRLVVEVSVAPSPAAGSGSSMQINFGAGAENWVSVPLSLGTVRYYLHRDGTLQLEPDTGPRQAVEVSVANGPLRFDTLLDKAVPGRTYSFNLNLATTQRVVVRVHVLAESVD